MKLELKHRKAVFWLVCIPTRSYLTYQALLQHWSVRPFAAVLAYRWLRGLEVGDEGFFGGPVWWADMRRLHGAMWGAYAVTGRWELLAADTAIGAMAWKNQFF